MGGFHSPKWVVLVGLVLLLITSCGDDEGSKFDTTAPAPVMDLAAVCANDSSIMLSWTAPGDDGHNGLACQYDIRYAAYPETTASWWDSASSISLVPKPSGEKENFLVTGLESQTTYYFALKTADEVLNWSDPSNQTSEMTWTVESGGPHAYGFLIAHINPSIEYSFSVSYEGQSGLEDYEQAVTDAEISSDKAQVWFVLACFAHSPGPVDLVGISFGLESFNVQAIEFMDYGPCNDGFLALPSDGWPGPNEGTALLFRPARKTELVEIYWFASYIYAPVSIELGPNRAMQGDPEGAFVDSSYPPVLDEIFRFGAVSWH